MANKNIKAFSFYKSYYEALKEIPEKDKKDIIFAMINYVFEDKKPKLKGINKVIWTLIEPNLDKSKNKSNGNAGAPIGNQTGTVVNLNLATGENSNITNNTLNANPQQVGQLKEVAAMNTSIKAWSNIPLPKKNTIDTEFTEKK